MNIGIVSYGCYIPRLRLQRSAIAAANKWFAPGLVALSKGERSMANWDEDSITMAVEASRDAWLLKTERGSAPCRWRPPVCRMRSVKTPAF